WRAHRVGRGRPARRRARRQGRRRDGRLVLLDGHGRVDRREQGARRARRVVHRRRHRRRRPEMERRQRARDGASAHDRRRGRRAARRVVRNRGRPRRGRQHRPAGEPSLGSHAMPTYAMLTTLGPDGWATVRENPERIREVTREVEGMGLKVIAQYALMGQYDFLNVIESPDEATMARAAIMLAARGTMRTTTLQAISVEELIQSLKTVG